MSRRLATNSGRDLPSAGQVAYFVHLHLDTAQDLGEHPIHNDERVYRVNGKARPMLVLAELKPERGRRWFHVLRITSKGLDEKGNPKEGHQRIGKCIAPEVDSCVVLELQRLPDNLLHPIDGGSAVVVPCDQFGFDQALKIIHYKFFQRGLADKGRSPASRQDDG